jgi:2-keto-3-deoxy-6-phosphogluconate aldolase
MDFNLETQATQLEGCRPAGCELMVHPQLKDYLYNAARRIAMILDKP